MIDNPYIVAILFVLIMIIMFLIFKLINNKNHLDKYEVKFKKLHHDAKIPKYAHHTDAGMDLYSIDDYELIPGIPVLVKTGLAIELPEGTEAQVRPRSGLALKETVTVLNAPGTIDQDYRGEIGVIMISLTSKKCITKEKPIIEGQRYYIKKGDKIAQLVINKLPEVKIVEVKELSNTERGEGGFGSTGK